MNDEKKEHPCEQYGSRYGADTVQRTANHIGEISNTKRKSHTMTYTVCTHMYIHLQKTCVGGFGGLEGPRSCPDSLPAWVWATFCPVPLFGSRLSRTANRAKSGPTPATVGPRADRQHVLRERPKTDSEAADRALTTEMNACSR